MEYPFENGFICQFESCKLIIENPTILPCGFSLCQEHLISLNVNDAFQCQFCKQEHVLPEDGFVLNRNLEAVMKNHNQLSHLHNETMTVFHNLNSLINRYDQLNEEEYIYDTFQNLRNKVDLHKEQLIHDITIKSEEIIKKLELKEQACRTNAHKLVKTGLNEMKLEMAEQKKMLRVPNINEEELLKLMNKIKEQTRDMTKKMRKYEIDLMLNETIEFRQSNNQFPFGELIENLSHIKLAADCGQLVRCFDGHLEPVTSIHLIQEQNLLLSTSKDCSVKIWNIENGECLKTLNEYIDKVICIMVFSDNKLISSGNFIVPSIKILDLKDFSCTKTFIVFSQVNCLAHYSVNEFAAGSEDGKITLFSNVAQIKSIQAHDGCVSSLKRTNDQSMLISSSKQQKNIRIWNLKSLKLIREIIGESEPIFHLTNCDNILYSNNTKYLGSSKYYSLIKLMNIQSGACTKRIEFNENLYCIKQLSNEIIAIGSVDVIIADLKQNKILRKLPVGNSYLSKVKHIELTSKGDILTVSNDASIKLWKMIDNDSC